MSDTEPTTPVTIRIPVSVFEKLMALENWESKTEAIITTIEFYIEHSRNPCVACGASNPLEAQFCMGCGAPLSKEAKTRMDLLKQDIEDHPEAIIKLLERILKEKQE